MKRIGWLILIVVAFSGCATIRGNTAVDKREYIGSMREQALENLYELRPQAEQQIREAAGYGVFSNINSHLLFLNSANGYGVVTDQSTGEDTYMRMFGLGAGLGLGIKDFRAIIIFKKRADLIHFIEKGWDFHGEADAVAMSGDKGGSASSAQSVNLDIITYQLTEAGILLQIGFQGTKFWKYADLN